MDPVAEYLFPPDLIIQKAQDIGLAEDQRGVIQEEVQKSHTRCTSDAQGMHHRLPRVHRWCIPRASLVHDQKRRLDFGSARLEFGLSLAPSIRTAGGCSLMQSLIMAAKVLYRPTGAE